MASIKRIQGEIKDILLNPLPNCSASPINNNLYKWTATILGPSQSPYEGGLFYLDIELPKNYPFSPPLITFKTRIYHCNISTRGDICLDILKERWSPALTLTKVLLSICSILDDPNPDDPLIVSIAELYKTDKETYFKIAKQYTADYAK